MIIKPIRASRGAPAVILPKSNRLSLAVTIPALIKPIRAINKPIPTLIARFNCAGIASIILSRSGDRVMNRKIKPLIKVIPKHCCHVYPNFIQRV